MCLTCAHQILGGNNTCYGKIQNNIISCTLHIAKTTYCLVLVESGSAWFHLWSSLIIINNYFDIKSNRCKPFLPPCSLSLIHPPEHSFLLYSFITLVVSQAVRQNLRFLVQSKSIFLSLGNRTPTFP